jgi:hypothetical protein
MIEPNKNFVFSMCSEEGKISSKRVISLISALTLVFLVVYSLTKPIDVAHISMAQYLFVGIIVFVLLMSGVATVKDILAFKNGNTNNTPPNDNNTPPQQ